MEINYIDLFCGLGGMRLGFESAMKSMGLSGGAVFSSEIKRRAIEAYRRNFGEIPDGDITQTAAADVPDFDFLLAGFPCQAFSSAGRRMGFEDARGTLFFDVARILKEKKPRGFLLENVEGLVSHDGKRTLAAMSRMLSDLGYRAGWEVLDGRDFGLAQSRRRIYIFGALGRRARLGGFAPRHSNLSKILDPAAPAKETEFAKKLLRHCSAKDAAGKKINDKRGGPGNIHSWDFGLKGEVSAAQKELLSLLLKQRRNKKWAEMHGVEWMDGMPLTLGMISSFFDSGDTGILKEMLDDLVSKGYLAYEHPKKKDGAKRVPDTGKPRGYNIVTGKLSFEYSKILDPQGIAPTLVATDAARLGVPAHGGIRPLTVREGLRLFGFPESYSLDFLKPKEAFDLLGNTVCVPVVEYVAKGLLESVFSEEGADAGIAGATV